MNSPFKSIGTSKVSIGKCLKMGSISLDLTRELYPPIRVIRHHIDDDNISSDKIYVVLIRDVIDKWKSGYLEELALLSKYYGDGDFNRFDPVTPKLMKMVHSLGYEGLGSKTWMFSGHAAFWQWNDYAPGMQLYFFMSQPNIYFLDLKDLSNLKFLEWLQEKDEKWKEVKEIPYDHQTPKNYQIQIDLFWKEYKEGKILQDRRYRSGQKRLICPFYDLPGNKLVPEFKTLHLMVKQQQEVVDFIRKNHERYIRL